MSFTTSLHGAVALVRDKRFGLLGQGVRQRWNSELTAFGLQRDLRTPFSAPDARVPITIRPLRSDDVDSLLALPDDASDADVVAVGVRRRMIDAGLPGCWVAVTTDDDPMYMQWLFGHEQNAALDAFFGDDFPTLTSDTALLEGAYTPATARGKRVMPAAMARIAERAARFGAHQVITFVGDDNVASLKGCERAGFSPDVARITRYRRFRKHTTFVTLTDTPSSPSSQRGST